MAMWDRNIFEACHRSLLTRVARAGPVMSVQLHSRSSCRFERVAWEVAIISVVAANSQGTQRTKDVWQHSGGSHSASRIVLVFHKAT